MVDINDVNLNLEDILKEGGSSAFVQPAKAAEFIILDFTIQPSGATFPE